MLEADRAPHPHQEFEERVRQRTIYTVLGPVLRGTGVKERNRGQRERRTRMADKAYCVKCKAKVDVKGGKKVKMKNGRPALKGTCSKCGTGVYKILPTK